MGCPHRQIQAILWKVAMDPPRSQPHLNPAIAPPSPIRATPPTARPDRPHRPAFN
ncbi:MAG: hypothetical protein Fur0042_30140 [Cyanophyceae cyanobacterium]